MTRKIDVELTSQSGEENWTWRAAGARMPKGAVSASLVPTGVGVGTLLRAEVEVGIDGIEILSLAIPVDPKAEKPVVNRIEIVGSRKEEADVIVTLARKGRSGGDRRGGPGGDSRGERRGGPGGDRRGDRRGGPGGDSRGERRGGPGGDRRGGPGGDKRPERGLPQSTVHRNLLLSELRAEQVPVAEMLFRGGLPSVREAISEQERSARQDGSPPPASDALLRMAEDLLLVTALAAWKDRAAAVQAAGSSVQMRDLRTTAVAAKTVKLDEEGRKLSQQIHEQLEHRVKAMETKWLESIDASLTEQKVAAALQAVASPPDRSLRCPAELAVRIAAATSEALNAELSPTDWIALLRVAAESPMKRSIKPAGIPADENAQAIARSLAGSIPALAQQLGLKMPPPPPKRSSVHRRVTPPANSAG